MNLMQIHRLVRAWWTLEVDASAEFEMLNKCCCRRDADADVVGETLEALLTLRLTKGTLGLVPLSVGPWQKGPRAPAVNTN